MMSGAHRTSSVNESIALTVWYLVRKRVCSGGRLTCTLSMWKGLGWGEGPLCHSPSLVPLGPAQADGPRD